MTKPELMIKNDEPVKLTCVHLGDHKDDLPYAKYGLAVELDDGERAEMRESIAEKLRALAVLIGHDEDDAAEKIAELDDVETTALVAEPFVLCWN